MLLELQLALTKLTKPALAKFESWVIWNVWWLVVSISLHLVVFEFELVVVVVVVVRKT